MDGPWRKPIITGGDYVPIVPVNGRLRSEVLGLHLEVDGDDLRLWDPETAKWLPTLEEETRAEKVARIKAQQELHQAVEAKQKAEDELARLRAQLGHDQRPRPSL
jgi:hypothetical protein